jgi:hypothetical protein
MISEGFCSTIVVDHCSATILYVKNMVATKSMQEISAEIDSAVIMILTTFKFDVPQFCQSAKLKPLPKFPNIYGIIVTVSFEAVHTAIGLALNDRNEV